MVGVDCVSVRMVGVEPWVRSKWETLGRSVGRLDPFVSNTMAGANV